VQTGLKNKYKIINGKKVAYDEGIDSKYELEAREVFIKLGFLSYIQEKFDSFDKRGSWNRADLDIYNKKIEIKNIDPSPEKGYSIVCQYEFKKLYNKESYIPYTVIEDVDSLFISVSFGNCKYFDSRHIGRKEYDLGNNYRQEKPYEYETTLDPSERSIFTDNGYVDVWEKAQTVLYGKAFKFYKN
jgi:hypothetical protein